MDYAKILPQLFLGSHPQGMDDIDKLRLDSGITAVLNLQTDEDMRSGNLTWEPLEAHYSACGIQLLRVPVRDFDPVDLRKKLPKCVRALVGLLTAGHSVYLHCTAGAGRSPTVAIAHLHWCRGWDLDAAAEYVKQRRPCSPNLEAIRLAAGDPVEDESTPRSAPQ
jgi:protein-tyrosine phosphatase